MGTWAWGKGHGLMFRFLHFSINKGRFRLGCENFSVAAQTPVGADLGARRTGHRTRSSSLGVRGAELQGIIDTVGGWNWMKPAC